MSFLDELKQKIDIPNNIRNWNAGMSPMRRGEGFNYTRRLKYGKSWMADKKLRDGFLCERFPIIQEQQAVEEVYDHERAGLFRKCSCRACRGFRSYLRWDAVIREWFVLGWSDGRVLANNPDDFKSRLEVSRIAQMVRQASIGLRLDGRRPTGRPRGRPRISPENSL
jgi:hypothetical protein